MWKPVDSFAYASTFSAQANTASIFSKHVARGMGGLTISAAMSAESSGSRLESGSMIQVSAERRVLW